MAKLDPVEVIDNDFCNVVVYTDGASSPNPGPSGSSVHGYVYLGTNINVKTSDKPLGYTITDKGYYPGELKESTEEYKLVKPSYYIEGMYVHSDIVTNNVAEVKAIIFALEELLRIDYLNIRNILLLTDSMYALGVFTKVNSGEEWRKPDLLNIEYYEILHKLISVAKQAEINISIDKVKGHDISLGNNIADRLAVGARIIAANNKTIVNEFNIIDGSKYWSSQFDRHPMLKYKQLFFLNGDRSIDHSYSIINYNALTELGTKAPDPMFGTFIPKIPVIEIEDVVAEFQRRSIGQHILLSTIDLSVLYKQRTSLYHNLFGLDVYTFNPKKKQLSILDDEPVVYAVTPSGLPKKAMDAMMEHFAIIEDYKKPENDRTRRYIDITNLFYKDGKKSKECIIDQNAKDIEVKVEYNGKEVIIPLCFNVDLPDRNTFKKIEKNDVKVSVVIDSLSDKALAYYVIVEDKLNSDYSVWCNFYSNKIVIG